MSLDIAANGIEKAVSVNPVRVTNISTVTVSLRVDLFTGIDTDACPDESEIVFNTLTNSPPG